MTQYNPLRPTPQDLADIKAAVARFTIKDATTPVKASATARREKKGIVIRPVEMKMLEVLREKGPLTTVQLAAEVMMRNPDCKLISFDACVTHGIERGIFRVFDRIKSETNGMFARRVCAVESKE